MTAEGAGEPLNVHTNPEDPYQIAATEIRNQLLASYAPENCVTILALVLGNIVGNITIADKLEPFLTELGVTMYREAKQALALREARKAAMQ